MANEAESHEVRAHVSSERTGVALQQSLFETNTYGMLVCLLLLTIF